MEPKTFDVTGRLHLVVRIRSGDIRITRADDDKVTVRVTGERGPDDVSIEAEASATGTVLHVRQPDETGLWVLRRRGVEIELSVPADTAANIATGSGDLEVDCSLAELAFQAGSGDAHIGDVTGSFRVKSASSGRTHRSHRWRRVLHERGRRHRDRVDRRQPERAERLG